MSDQSPSEAARRRPSGTGRLTSAPRRSRLLPLVVLLGLLTGCTAQPQTAQGSSPAEQALAALQVEAAGSGDDYSRLDQFGDWADPDGNGCDARNDVLARDLVDEVLGDDGCTVRSGTLHDPYTATTIQFVRGPATSADVQIDHVVALKNAWISGADRLGQDDRVALANDPLNLQAVDGPTNGDKSASDASQWLPPNEEYHCEYVARQIAVKTRYGLSVTTDEKQAMSEVLSGCPDQDVPESVASAQAADAGAAPAQEQDIYYENCEAVRAAGAAPLHEEDPGYRPELDRGGAPGVACEG